MTLTAKDLQWLRNGGEEAKAAVEEIEALRELLRIVRAERDELAAKFYTAAPDERERWAKKCDEVAAILVRDSDEKKQISAQMADWLAEELRA